MRGEWKYLPLLTTDRISILRKTPIFADSIRKDEMPLELFQRHLSISNRSKEVEWTVVPDFEMQACAPYEQ
jgi:hypothetical protein